MKTQCFFRHIDFCFAFNNLTMDLFLNVLTAFLRTLQLKNAVLYFRGHFDFICLDNTYVFKRVDRFFKR